MLLFGFNQFDYLFDGPMSLPVPYTIHVQTKSIGSTYDHSLTHGQEAKSAPTSLTCIVARVTVTQLEVRDWGSVRPFKGQCLERNTGIENLDSSKRYMYIKKVVLEAY